MTLFINFLIKVKGSNFFYIELAVDFNIWVLVYTYKKFLHLFFYF